MNIKFVIAIVLSLSTAIPLWDGADISKSSLEEDFQRLQGKWVKRTSGEEWILNFNAQPPAFQLAISVSAPPFTAAKTGVLSGLQEDAHGRYFELGPGNPSRPQRIYYRFDQDQLILDIALGPVLGKHVLVRNRETALPQYVLIIGTVILGAVVLAAAVILFGTKTKRPSNIE